MLGHQRSRPSLATPAFPPGRTCNPMAVSPIGPNQDSFYEYLLKAYILFGDPEYLAMFDDFYVAINTYMKKEDWYVDVNMDKGQVSLPWFTALGGFW